MMLRRWCARGNDPEVREPEPGHRHPDFNVWVTEVFGEAGLAGRKSTTLRHKTFPWHGSHSRDHCHTLVSKPQDPSSTALGQLLSRWPKQQLSFVGLMSHALQDEEPILLRAAYYLPWQSSGRAQTVISSIRRLRISI